MKKETYDYLWKNAIVPAIMDVEKSISEEIRKEYRVTYHENLEEKKRRIFEEYDTQRCKVRKKYFDTGKDDENLIDIHKICACFTAALLEVRIFDYKKIDSSDPKKMAVFYSNYSVAFLTGIHMMYLELLSEFQRSHDTDLFNLLKDQKTFIFPETNSGHDGYVQGRIKTLALNDVYGVDFDILTYADMLFWIERYNMDILVQKKLKIKQCDDHDCEEGTVN